MTYMRPKLLGLVAAIGAVSLPISSAFAAYSPLPADHARSASTVGYLSLPYDGTDPNATGCANSAVTATNTAVYHAGRYFGNLALRWSTACKTNWGKFSGNGNVGSVSVWVYRQADNKWCGDQSGTGCGAVWWPNSAYSNQLYGCNYNTLAQVEVYNNGSPFYADTRLVGGC